MRRRTSAGAIAAVVAAFVVAGCGSSNSTAQDTTAPPETVTTQATETTETTPPATTTETTSKPKPKPKPTVRTIVVVVENGRPRGGIARPKVKLGERVRLQVRSDIAEEVHVHGFDISKDVRAGGTAVITFKATLAGRFEIEFEHSAVQLAELSVTP